MDAGRKRKIETRGEVAQEEENKKKQVQLGQVHCNYCKRNISDQIYIKNASCEDVDLCLECFSVGVEIKDVKKTDGKHPHRNNCNYKVMERLDFPILVEGWTAREEIALLDGIDSYGIGNWKQVAEVVGTKEERDCELHYFAYYINTASGEPVPNVTKATSKVNFPKGKIDFDECVEAAIAGAGRVPGKLTKSEWKKHMIETKGITRENIKYYEDKPAGCDQVGFMPARGDMDVEWENDTEQLICDCHFDDKKDTEQDKELKMKILEAYNWKLEERIRRKSFILERNLLDYKKQHSQERRRTKDERELWQHMRQFARFWPQEEHEEYMRGLILERKIRKRIEQLQTFRRAGLHNFADADAFEDAKKKKEQEDRLKRSKNELTPYLPPKASAAQRSERLRMRNEEDITELGSLDPPPAQGGKKPGMFDISGMPGVDLLGLGEKQFCVQQRMNPSDFIEAKEAMHRESFRHGSLRVEQAKMVCKLDGAKAAKVHEFMVSAGWLTPHQLDVGL
mmetsp:Transcript_37358/g.72988  ORF Transcript_37358/g.72988 Transcript_37358/m.72988 type:complete len:510 (-) Transcript_37358:136-1665(-)